MRWLVAISVLGLAACGSAPAPDPGSPPVYEDRDVQAAVADARASLDVFWAAFDGGDPSHESFSLTVITPSKAYEKDYVSVSDIARQGAAYIGVVPDYHEDEQDGFKPGDVIEFTAADIADWRYMDNEQFRGAFTSRAMWKFVPDGTDISNITRAYHEDPLP